MADQHDEQKQPVEPQPISPLPKLAGNSVLESGSANPRQKTEWPELVGLTPEEAKKRITEEEGSVRIIDVVPPGFFVTMDFNSARVRLFVDSDGKVIRAPRIG